MDYLETLCISAKKASRFLRRASTLDKSRALARIADELRNNAKKICAENDKDVISARENGMREVMIDRLKLTPERINSIASAVEEVIALDDPIGRITDMKTRPNGLKIGKKTVALGVIGVIYESRPNVTVDTAVLCLKSSNAVILRGGSDAYNSNKILSDIMRNALSDEGFDPNCICFMDDTSRETVTEFMKMDKYVDVLIPRGGAGLINTVVHNSTIPVIQTGVGNCHIYIDKSADAEMAADIVINAKTSRPSVCNAAETVLIHKDADEKVFKLLEEKLKEKHVELRGCKETMKKIDCDAEATEQDYETEFLALTLAIRTVNSLDEAMEHIEKYSTGHSECIVTNDWKNANRFLDEIDSAAVYVNASTRFTDGNEFGLGAEIGISTQKLHARGPMGLEELTSTKYIVLGDGQIR